MEQNRARSSYDLRTKNPLILGRGMIRNIPDYYVDLFDDGRKIMAVLNYPVGINRAYPNSAALLIALCPHCSKVFTSAKILDSHFMYECKKYIVKNLRTEYVYHTINLVCEIEMVHDKMYLRSPQINQHFIHAGRQIATSRERRGDSVAEVYAEMLHILKSSRYGNMNGLRSTIERYYSYTSWCHEKCVSRTIECVMSMLDDNNQDSLVPYDNRVIFQIMYGYINQKRYEITPRDDDTYLICLYDCDYCPAIYEKLNEMKEHIEHVHQADMSIHYPGRGGPSFNKYGALAVSDASYHYTRRTLQIRTKRDILSKELSRLHHWEQVELWSPFYPKFRPFKRWMNEIQEMTAYKTGKDINADKYDPIGSFIRAMKELKEVEMKRIDPTETRGIPSRSPNGLRTRVPSPEPYTPGQQ